MGAAATCGLSFAVSGFGEAPSDGLSDAGAGAEVSSGAWAAAGQMHNPRVKDIATAAQVMCLDSTSDSLFMCPRLGYEAATTEDRRKARADPAGAGLSTGVDPAARPATGFSGPKGCASAVV